MKKTLGWLLLGVLFAATALSAQGIAWSRLPGEARDIAIGGNGGNDNDVVWMVEKAGNILWGGYVCRWDKMTEQWVRMGGMAESITVNNIGNPWVVNGEGKIFQWVINKFEYRPGFNQEMLARDIGIGNSDFFAFIISRLDGHIYKYTNANWRLIAEFKNKGVARRIDVDSNGNPWVVTDTGIIYRYDVQTGTWFDMSYKIESRNRRSMMYARDIGCDFNGSEAWIAAKENLAGGGRLYYTTIDGLNAWYLGGGIGIRLDLSDGEVLMVNASGEIWWGSLL